MHALFSYALFASPLHRMFHPASLYVIYCKTFDLLRRNSYVMFFGVMLYMDAYVIPWLLELSQNLKAKIDYEIPTTRVQITNPVIQSRP